MSSPPRCDRCGFDAADWNEQDTVQTLLQASSFIDLWAEGLDAAQRPEPPADDPPSAQAIHRLWHHLDDLYQLAVRAEPSLTVQRGSVARLNLSTGGVPKVPVAAAEVGWRGIEGDVQAVRRHHGRPWQALCLWSSDVIDALVAEGHPLGPGAAGENITVDGVDWASLRAGMLVEIDSVLCRLSAPAVPCRKNAQWFADGDSRRIAHDRHPGWSRWYASVLRPGRIETGADVIVRPT